MQSGDLVGSWKMSCVCETRDERRRRKREIPARGTGRRDEIPETRSAASRAASAFFSLVRRASRATFGIASLAFLIYALYLPNEDP